MRRRCLPHRGKRFSADSGPPGTMTASWAAVSFRQTSEPRSPVQGRTGRGSHDVQEVGALLPVQGCRAGIFLDVAGLGARVRWRDDDRWGLFLREAGRLVVSADAGRKWPGRFFLFFLSGFCVFRCRAAGFPAVVCRCRAAGVLNDRVSDLKKHKAGRHVFQPFGYRFGGRGL